MSEYQYYEFQAIDRPLTDRQMQDLRGISSRAAISRRRFTNYYTFGDLKANPRDLLARYFDASLYFAHWHFLELAFRYPKNAVDVKLLRRYGTGQSLQISSKGTDIIVAMSVERDDFDAADDGQGWLSSLILLRSDIARGDERALYVAWLLGVQQREIRDSAIEPARPDDLGTPSPALESFIDVMGVDRDLVEAAVEGAVRAPARPSKRRIDRWLAALDETDRVALLSRMARGETAVGAELVRRFRLQTERREPTRTPRTAGALRARARELAEQRRLRTLAREAKQHARRARKQAAARDRHLNTLTKRQAAAWRHAETLIATRRSGDYDAAVALLKDLRDVTVRTGKSIEFAGRMRALRGVHATKPSFLARLRRAGL
jgi:hypothetical protein